MENNFHGFLFASLYDAAHNKIGKTLLLGDFFNVAARFEERRKMKIAVTFPAESIYSPKESMHEYM